MQPNGTPEPLPGYFEPIREVCTKCPGRRCILSAEGKPKDCPKEQNKN